MVVITVKYDGETYVSEPFEDSLENCFHVVRNGDENLKFPLNDGKLILIKSEAIKRAVFLFEEV